MDLADGGGITIKRWIPTGLPHPPDTGRPVATHIIMIATTENQVQVSEPSRGRPRTEE